MVSQIQLGELTVDVVRKDIKNVHLSVYPPSGRVRISAPKRMSMETIRVFAISKLDWIRRNQAKLQAQPREAPREYVDRESHFVWGQRYLLAVQESNNRPSVELRHNHLVLWVRPGTEREKRRAVMEKWYRDQIKAAVPLLLARWEPLLGVNVERFYVQRMRTRWGSCNTKARTIRLNTELATKPPELLEYILVHELVHLLEPSHNDRFTGLMDSFMPNWKHHRQTLNSLPLRST